MICEFISQHDDGPITQAYFKPGYYRTRRSANQGGMVSCCPQCLLSAILGLLCLYRSGFNAFHLAHWFRKVPWRNIGNIGPVVKVFSCVVRLEDSLMKTLDVWADLFHRGKPHTSWCVCPVFDVHLLFVCSVYQWKHTFFIFSTSGSKWTWQTMLVVSI